jgi:hypothetical protein
VNFGLGVMGMGWDELIRFWPLCAGGAAHERLYGKNGEPHYVNFGLGVMGMGWDGLIRFWFLCAGGETNAILACSSPLLTPRGFRFDSASGVVGAD